MNRDEARNYFKNIGLSYANLQIQDINTLLNIVSEELELYLKTGGEHAEAMGMEVRKLLKKDVKILKDGLKYAFIRVKGSYFESREAISFNQNGFIGFGGELDDKNVQPLLKAFCRWCDKISN